MDKVMDKFMKKGANFANGVGSKAKKGQQNEGKQLSVVDTTADEIPRFQHPARSLLQEIMLVTGYSKTRLARELGLSTTTCHYILTGRIINTSLKTFQKILRLYLILVYLPNQKI